MFPSMHSLLVRVRLFVAGGRFKKEMVIDGQSYLLLIRDEGGPPELQVGSSLSLNRTRNNKPNARTPQHRVPAQMTH